MTLYSKCDILLLVKGNTIDFVKTHLTNKNIKMIGECKMNKENIIKNLKEKLIYRGCDIFIKPNDLYSFWCDMASKAKWKSIKRNKEDAYMPPEIEVTTDINVTVFPNGRMSPYKVMNWQSIHDIVKYTSDKDELEIDINEDSVEIVFEDNGYNKYEIRFNL